MSAVGLSAEINIKAMYTKVAKAINNTTTHTSAVNEDRVSIVLR